MFLLLNPFYQNSQCLIHSKQDHCPTGISKSGGVKYSKCHPIEQM
jgi:hypothetical protein